MVSASGTCVLGQWISRRSTSVRRSRARLSLVARSNSRGARCDCHTLVVMNTSLRGTREARRPSPTSRSLSYISAVSMWRSPRRRACSTMRAQVRPLSSQVPSPIAGILAPLASTKCMNGKLAQDRPIMPWAHHNTNEIEESGLAVGYESGFRQRRKDHVGGMRDHRQQRPRRTARSTLALLPVPDGFDGNAEPRGELLLGELRATAQVAHLRRSTRARRRHRFGGERKLLSVPQL